jgi:HEPN domain-containing protein
MKLTTGEWIDKAEDDWVVAQQSYRARKHPVYDAACFHAQQCVEKYLKARLEEAGAAFPKTHDLLRLLSLAVRIEPGWTVLHPNVITLSAYAVEFRYPGKSATKLKAKQAIKDCREVRRIIRATFGLPI